MFGSIQSQRILDTAVLVVMPSVAPILSCRAIEESYLMFLWSFLPMRLSVVIVLIVLIVYQLVFLATKTTMTVAYLHGDS